MEVYAKIAPTYNSPHNQKFQNKYWEIISLCDCDDGCDECVDGEHIKKALLKLTKDKFYQDKYEIVAIENNLISLHKIKEIRGQMKFIKLTPNSYIRVQVIRNIIKILNG